VEIPFEGRGWVATDPSPLFAETTGSVLEDDTTATSTTLPTGAVVDEPVQPRELNPDEGTDEDVATEDGIGGWLTVIIVGTGLVLALVALVGARIVRRRSRQRRPEPDLLVLGAWAELVDRLRENGRAPSSSTTTDEVVALADEIDPAVGAAARPLADLAAEALHAPLSPTRAEAKIAWDRLEDTEHALIDVRGRRVTARRLVDPRVLRYRAPEPPPRDRTAVTTAVDG
jgi:hypothetical protein